MPMLVTSHEEPMTRALLREKEQAAPQPEVRAAPRREVASLASLLLPIAGLPPAPPTSSLAAQF